MTFTFPFAWPYFIHWSLLCFPSMPTSLPRARKPHAFAQPRSLRFRRAQAFRGAPKETRKRSRRCWHCCAWSSSCGRPLWTSAGRSKTSGGRGVSVLFALVQAAGGGRGGNSLCARSFWRRGEIWGRHGRARVRLGKGAACLVLC